MGIQTSLDDLVGSQRIVDSMRLADDLAFHAGRDAGVRTIRVLRSALASDNQVAAIAATHALAEVFDEQADVTLSELLSDERAFLREHAAWALGSRLPRLDAIGRLIGMVVDGGFTGMLAQRTLEQWAVTASDHIAIGLESALIGVRDADRRYRLVETLGLVRTPTATRRLVTISRNPVEPLEARVAAVSALGQRRDARGIEQLLDGLAADPGYLGEVARLALLDLAAPTVERDEREGLTVVQLFLHADIDADLSQAGSGDNGGIATLLVRLGDALVADSATRVITMSRGDTGSALQSARTIAESDTGHLYGTVPLLSESVQSANAWPLRVAARRGIRRMLRAAGRVDLLHLRMADVGSLAAADVARELDIPVVFTVAPDPHAVINSMDLSGRLTPQNFGDVDEREHFWFRARLVQQLASNAAHTVLFPRPELARDMRELVGIDITAHPERHTIVPEGVDLGVIDAAVAEAADHAAGQPASDALDELSGLLERLPAERRGLPLIVSVGRFHRVKGMATIVETWATNGLRDRANLLLVGGDLAHPSADEAEQLALIDAVIAPGARDAAGLIIPGHRPNDTVARWVAAARFGVPGLAAPRGIYVCGSLKEEFGIALLEAMASGLVVVAPDGGGPATYVEPGVTGFLTTTWDTELMGRAMIDALALAGAEADDSRASRSRETVERSFTIQAMARALTSLYARVHREESDLQESLVSLP
ncbi:MAG: glycosyltransferase [Microbacteriaceae bacterium]|nr:glycosyltransferase [Microbacteriaceae bacterium]